MITGRFRVAAGLLAGVSALMAIAIFQTLPRHAGAAEAASVGGCSAGLCHSELNALCGSVGDGCASYGLCNSSTGDFLCTPEDFCTAAGCHVVHGGICH